MGHDEPWVQEDIWTDAYERDVERMQRISRGFGWAFAVFAIALLGAIVAFLALDGPWAIIRLVFSGVGDN